MMELTEKEISFLDKEFGLKKEVLSQLTRKEWAKIQERCFDVEVDEVIEADEGNGPLSERGIISVQLSDYIYDVIIPLLKNSDPSKK